MEDNFNKHLGNKLKLRRLALGLTQTKVAKAINVTFQQIQKYEKGTNGVSSIRLLQLANYLKVPVNYFFEDFSEYLINLERSQEGHMNVNYNFLVKLYSELNNSVPSGGVQQSQPQQSEKSSSNGLGLAGWFLYLLGQEMNNQNNQNTVKPQPKIQLDCETSFWSFGANTECKER